MQPCISSCWTSPVSPPQPARILSSAKHRSGFLWKWQTARFLDWGLKHWRWWRRLHPPPPLLAAIRIPTRQIYGHLPQVGPSPINRYFTPAICFVAGVINLVGEAGKRRRSGPTNHRSSSSKSREQRWWFWPLNTPAHWQLVKTDEQPPLIRLYIFSGHLFVLLDALVTSNGCHARSGYLTCFIITIRRS